LLIIRALFWLTVVLLLIPGGGSKNSASLTSGAADAVQLGRLKARDAAPGSLPERAAGQT